MDALKWLEQKELERKGRADKIASLIILLVIIVVLVGIWWLTNYVTPKPNTPNLGAFLLGIFLLSIFANNSIYSLDSIGSGQARWLLSLPIHHKRFVLKPLWENIISVFAVLIVLAVVSLAWGRKIHAITLSGSIVAIVAFGLTSVAIASMSLISFSFRNSHGWKRFVGSAIYALFVFFVVGTVLSIAFWTLPETAHGSEAANSALRWLIILMLFPFLPVFAAMKAITDGVTVKTIAWLIGYALFAALTFVLAMKRAPEFCEAIFLEEGKRQKATMFSEKVQTRSKKESS